MSKKDIYLFVTRNEFNVLCETRLDSARQKLYDAVLAIRNPESTDNELVTLLDDVMMEVSWVKLDMEELVRRGAK